MKGLPGRPAEERILIIEDDPDISDLLSQELTRQHYQVQAVAGGQVGRHEVKMGDRLVQLTPTEFALLRHMAKHPGRPFTRDQLITALWGEDRFVEEHNLDVHVHALRRNRGANPRIYKIVTLTLLACNPRPVIYAQIKRR